MAFKTIFDQYNWQKIQDSIYSKTSSDVEIALSRAKTGSRDPAFTLNDFKALISPAAAPFLEEIAGLSQQLTQKRFGKTVQMYIPLYLSNECQNICTYCGYSFNNNINRTTLTDEQILEEVQAIKSLGFDHILLVTGEADKTVGLEYFKNALKLTRSYFSHISMEIQPLDREDYEQLIYLGLNTVYIYQETYNKTGYKTYHLKGRKSNFYSRLETPDRLGSAGIYKIGLGCLIGLENWRTDAFFTMLHLNYLEKKYWKTKYSISFPRLRPAEGAMQPKVLISDKELVQLICAYRILNEEVELSLSTRESMNFRDNVIKLGITSVSAGSKTYPGGYTKGRQTLKQFEISDQRTPHEIVEMIKSRGYEAVWKDWDAVMG